MGLIRELCLPEQLFLSKCEPAPELMQPVESFAPTAYLAKPGGGLWTSTYDANGGSQWLRFSEQIGHHDQETRAFLLTPRSCRVCVIDGDAAYMELLSCYQYHGEYTAFLPPHLFPLLEWERIAETCDAVWLPRGRIDIRINSPLYGWDVESTLWMHWCFESVREIPLN